MLAAVLALSPALLLAALLACAVAVALDAAPATRLLSRPPRPTPEAPAPDLPPWAQVAHPATDRSAMVRGAEQAVRTSPDLSAVELDVTELLELVRHDLVHACVTSGRKSALLLAKRSPLSDAAAWSAVSWDLSTRSRLADAADFLSEGRVLDAAKACARFCGMELDEWVAETRRELALEGVL